MLFPCVHGFPQWTPRSSVSPKHADFDWSWSETPIYHISGLAMDWSTVQTVSCPDKYWDWLQLQLQSKERPSCRRTVVQTKVRVTNLQLLGPVEQNMAFIWGSMRSGFVRFLQIQTHMHGKCVCMCVCVAELINKKHSGRLFVTHSESEICRERAEAVLPSLTVRLINCHGASLSD